jgi:hypothetical protein
MTPEAISREVFENARENAGALWMVGAAFAREHGIPTEAWARFVGEQYARGWEELEGDLGKIADQVALNFESCGGEVRERSTSSAGFDVVVVWPAGELRGFAEDLGLTDAETAPLVCVFEPIADRVGLRLTTQVQADAIRLHFAKA